MATRGGRPAALIYEVVMPVWHNRPGTKLRWVEFLRAMVDLLGIWRDRRRVVRHV